MTNIRAHWKRLDRTEQDALGEDALFELFRRQAYFNAVLTLFNAISTLFQQRLC